MGDLLMNIIYPLCAWIFFIVVINQRINIKKLEDNLKHYPENEKLLKEKLEKELLILDKKINEDFTKGNLNIKVPRVPLGNLIRSYKSSYVYLSMFDITKLKIDDGAGTATTMIADIISKNNNR